MVFKLLKEKEGFEPKTLNKMLGYATDNERKELRKLFISEIENNGNDPAEAEKLFDDIEADGIRERIDREMAMNVPDMHLYHSLPHIEPYYYDKLPGTGKHSGGCNRKSKPRKKVKHGNRKACEEFLARMEATTK